MGREVEQWITVNGQHIPIYKGQTKDEAIKFQQEHRKQVDDEEDRKEKQISANKKQADEMNGKKEDIRHVTEDEFNEEAKRQGTDLTADDIVDYVTSSYGEVNLGDDISKFIDKAPEEMHVKDTTLYRGLTFNSKKEYEDFIKKAGNNPPVIESRRDGLSWTTDEKVADNFGKNTDYDYSVTLVNEDEEHNAISIKAFADTPESSSEVLYSSSSDFEIVDVKVDGSHAIMYVTQTPFTKPKYKE